MVTYFWPFEKKKRRWACSAVIYQWSVPDRRRCSISATIEREQREVRWPRESGRRGLWGAVMGFVKVLEGSHPPPCSKSSNPSPQFLELPFGTAHLYNGICNIKLQYTFSYWSFRILNLSHILRNRNKLWLSFDVQHCMSIAQYTALQDCALTCFQMIVIRLLDGDKAHVCTSVFLSCKEATN